MLLKLVVDACCWPLVLVGPVCCFATPLLIHDFVLGAPQQGSVLVAQGDSAYTRKNILIFCWVGVEAVFYLWFRRVLKEAQERHQPTKTTKDKRAAIWAGIRKCNEGKEDPYKYLRNYFSFPLEKIGRDDIQEFYSEAMFNCPITDLTSVEMSEMNASLDIMESDIKCPFPPTTVGKLPPLMRLNHDPVLALAKPCVYYAASHLLDFCSDVFLMLLGFSRHRSGALTYWLLRRPKMPSLIGENIEGGIEKYPILFIHGVGLGLVTYVQFIVNLMRATPDDQPIILLELPHASMKLNVDIIPSMKILVDCTVGILTAHHFARAHFIAHSLGSFIFGAVNYYSPSIVESVVLIDPVCFKLWEPHVMSNFCYRIPTTAMQAVMKHLVTRELTISHYFHRHFFWTECVLFREDVPKITRVILSELDEIIDGPDVGEYLRACPDIKVDILTGGHHGQWTVDWRSLSLVVDAVVSTVATANSKTSRPLK